MHIGAWRDVEGKEVTEAGAAAYDPCPDGRQRRGPNFTLRHFEVPRRPHPFHAHPWEHEVFVSRKGTVKRKDGGTDVGPGSFVFVRRARSTRSRTLGARLLVPCAIPATKVC